MTSKLFIGKEVYILIRMACPNNLVRGIIIIIVVDKSRKKERLSDELFLIQNR